MAGPTVPLKSSGCTKGEQLGKKYTVLTQLYCQIHINISTTCFSPYGHRQVEYSIRGKKTA